METIRLLIVIVLVGISGYFLVDTYFKYKAATGSTMDRLIAASRSSATILLQRAVSIVMAVVGVLAEVADKLDPGVGDTIKSIKPEFYLAFTVGLALLSILARNRTLP